MRPAGALRLRRDQIAHHVPQCCEIFAVDLAVERLAFRRLLYGFHDEPPVILVAGLIDSILTTWLASMKQTRKFRGGSDEAARLFPQQRVLPGQNRAESKGTKRNPPAAPSPQGRTAPSRLSRDQSAGAGPDAAGRSGRGHHPIAGHHRMAGGNPSRTAAASEGPAAPRQGPRVCDGARLRYPSGAEPESAGEAAATRPARGTGDGLGGMGQPRGSR